MPVRMNLTCEKAQNGWVPKLTVTNVWTTPEDVLVASEPVVVEIMNPDATTGMVSSGYSNVQETPDGLTGECQLQSGDSAFRVVDHWTRVDSDTWQVNRCVTMTNRGGAAGFRQRLDFITAFPEGVEFTGMRYFAPPILYDHNDLDNDGVEDYLETQNLTYREDRLNIRAVMAYHEKRHISLCLIRADRPEFDTVPDRPNKERVFAQKTDVGSLGFWNSPGAVPQMRLRASFPFDEGERSHALVNEDRPGWQAFWPAADGETIETSYRIRVEEASDFHEALWQTNSRMLQDLHPVPVDLQASPDDLVAYRLEALNRYYVELDKDTDPNEPAGYVLNCHPQDGEQLSDIIQYGFTGQNILNAYNVLRYAYMHGNEEYLRRARRVIEFFVNKAHIPGTGMFYNLYNVDKKTMDYWWTGLLLPLAYAKPGESLEQLMGPIYNHWHHVIEKLQTLRGSYLRCMSEDAYALLLSFELEKRKGNYPRHWLDAAVRYGEFLLRSQEKDGSWYRAYDMTGNALTDPAIWFGTTVYEQKSSSATAIPFLVKLAEITGDDRYLQAACRAGRFVREMLVDPVRCNGGIHDSMYSKGQLIDNEGVLYPMLGLLALYRAVGGEYFRQGAIRAARLVASWICLWDVPLPADSTLARYGFRSTGLGACDTCGAGYVHPFQLLIVPELVEVAEMTGDPTLVDIAELLFHGSNQTVAVPGKDWGYRHLGLQEEGYLISWCWIDDPVFEDTSFGHRWKGEGNKTCFPWIPGVAVYGYWKMRDRFGTFDFKAIRQRISAKVTLDGE